MARIEVQPTALEGGAGRAAQLADELSAVRGQLQATASQIEGALAGGGSAGAAADALNGWGSALDGLASYSSTLGTNLGAAASAYVRTDSSAIDGG